MFELMGVVYHLGEGIDSLRNCQVGVEGEKGSHREDDEKGRNCGVDEEVRKLCLYLILQQKLLSVTHHCRARYRHHEIVVYAHKGRRVLGHVKGREHSSDEDLR